MIRAKEPSTAEDAPCPCGSGGSLADCCGPIIGGVRTAATAEALMRSRYTAYVLDNQGYLRDSRHPRTRALQIDEGPAVSSRLHWIGLKILATRAGNAGDAEGIVDFVARYKVGGRAFRLHEISRFERIGERWYYVDGTAGPTDTTGAGVA